MAAGAISNHLHAAQTCAVLAGFELLRCCTLRALLQLLYSPTTRLHGTLAIQRRTTSTQNRQHTNTASGVCARDFATCNKFRNQLRNRSAEGALVPVPSTTTTPPPTMTKTPASKALLYNINYVKLGRWARWANAVDMNRINICRLFMENLTAEY